jgi:aspartyl-tRNA synthetase
LKINVPAATELDRTQILHSISDLLKQQGWDMDGHTDHRVYMLNYGPGSDNSFKHEAGLVEKMNPQQGDVLITMVRPDRNPASGFTNIGRVRLALHDILVQMNFLPEPSGWNFLWVTDFPLISLDESAPYEPRNSYYVSTHHPFTAPKTAHDVDLLASDPTRAVAAHYDLVLNGVELGGGSRRIHSAAMQAYVLRHVLRLSEKRIQDFEHLLQVLDSGCPPHAGIAIGFDRMIAIMRGTKSVRDVIAFPKSGSGEDPLVGSPALLEKAQLETYHLALR